jgi:hypothetical protein
MLPKPSLGLYPGGRCDRLGERAELERRTAALQILFFAITTAPITATSNNREAISKANM